MALAGGEALQIGGGAQPGDVRVAAQYAAAATGGVEEDGVKWCAVPPGGGIGGVCGFEGGAQAEAIKVFLDAHEAVAVVVKRE